MYRNCLYVYTPHDEADATYFDMFDWRLFSTADLATWQDHVSVFLLKDFAWTGKWAWAPDAVRANSKYYRFLPTDPARIDDGGSRIAAFAFQCCGGDTWRAIFTGTKIAAFFQKRLEPVTAQTFRFRVLAADLEVFEK